ncbi:hypothetical protein THAOC_19263, partial [Thalassiosira oceanica]
PNIILVDASCSFAKTPIVLRVDWNADTTDLFMQRLSLPPHFSVPLVFATARGQRFEIGSRLTTKSLKTSLSTYEYVEIMESPTAIRALAARCAREPSALDSSAGCLAAVGERRKIGEGHGTYKGHARRYVTSWIWLSLLSIGSCLYVAKRPWLFRTSRDSASHVGER